MGSIISLHHLERIEAMVKLRKTGVILAGGQRMKNKSNLDGFDFSHGHFFPPTVIADISIEDELWKEEIFGPVVVVKRFTVSLIFSILMASVVNKTSWLRTSAKAFHWQMNVNMALERVFGQLTCPEHIVQRQKLKLVWSG
jgi:delta 1-pyrroline-5-carboxylate dehydrogenase